MRALPALGDQRGTGYYKPGPPDGVSPGVLWFNMAMLSTRPIPTLETLTLHEGIPGHHYQITLVLEDASLPAILRFGGLTAYSEGWGLYAESLGRELGMFEDPLQWFGHLDMEMLRAVRLVVDTGLHAQQWSRQRAIDYMLANTSMAPRDVQVRVDAFRLDQVIGNLIGNAMKFTPPGGTIGIGAHVENNLAVIDVWDTGRGVPEDAVPRLFEKFFQVQKGDTRLAGGAGLGLYIVRQLVEAQGGVIGVTSEEGAGARFSVRFAIEGASS